MSSLKGKIGLMAASLIMMSYLAPTSCLAAIAESFPDTPQQIVQLLSSVPNLTSVIVMILVSRVTPFIYKKHLIFISALLYPAAGLLIYFIHPNVLIMILFSLLMGAGTGICVTFVPALICDCYNEKESAQLIGLQSGFISGGAMLFIWIGGQFAKVQWEKCYLCYLFILIIAVVEWFCVPKGKLDLKKEKGEPHTAIPGSILFYCIMFLFFGIFIFTFNSNISLFITQRSLGGTVEASYASIIYNLAGMATGCVTGFVLSRLKYKVFSCSIIVAAVGMLLCFFSTGFAVLCIGAIFCGAAYSIAIPAGNYYASIESTDYNRSFSIALLNALSGGGMLISPIFFGTVLTMLTISQRFLASGIGMVLLLAAVCVGQRQMHRKIE